MSRPLNARSISAPPKPHRPPPSRPDGKQFPPSRPKSLLSRFRRVSQYDAPFSSSPSSSSSPDMIGSLITIPTLERMREWDRNEVDVDWEKVKTLPRVCLVPPEGTSRARDGECSYFTPSPPLTPLCRDMKLHTQNTRRGRS